MTLADFERLADKVRNWGRWGSEDQRGTLNHVGPEALKRGAAAVKAGKAFSLGLNLDKHGPQFGPIGRFNPKLYVTDLSKPFGPGARGCFSDDVILMPPQAATHWDAFAHVHYDGVLYNGCKACDVLTIGGALRHGVEHLAQGGIMSRGVLLDVARLHGVDELNTNHVITVDELNRSCAAQGVSINPGDIVLIRTGHIRSFTVRDDRPAFHGQQAGVGYQCAEWLHDKQVAAVAADNLAVEILTADMLDLFMPLPFHNLALRDMGCPLGEMFNLEALAADCAIDKQYDFLLAAPPLGITGAFGAPVNPMALK